MDLIPLLARILISQSKWGTRRGIQTRQVSQARHPYLFILAMDVLGHMLDDPKHEIDRLHLPKKGCVQGQTFADDTALYLKGSQSNLNKVRAVLELFCLASRAKVNWGKFAAIWDNKEKKEWE